MQAVNLFDDPVGEVEPYSDACSKERQRKDLWEKYEYREKGGEGGRKKGGGGRLGCLVKTSSKPWMNPLWVQSLPV